MKQRNLLELKRKSFYPIAVWVFSVFSLGIIVYIYQKGSMDFQTLMLQFIPTVLFIYFGIWLFQKPAFELSRESLKVNNVPIGKIEFQISKIEHIEYDGKKIRFSYDDNIQEFGLYTGFVSINRENLKTLHEKLIELTK